MTGKAAGMTSDVRDHDHQAEIARLRRSLEELSVINDLSRALSESFDQASIMKAVIRKANRVVGAEQATVTLVDDGDFGLKGTLVRDVRNDADPDFHLNQNLIGLMLVKRRPFIFNDPHHAPQLAGVQIQPGIRDLVCAPLLVGERVIGVLAAYNSRGPAGFSADDQRLLSLMAAQSAQVLERARLLAEEQAAAQAREELRLAAVIQAGLLPSTAPPSRSYEISGVTRAAKTVGGDYYDFIDLGSDKLGVAIADISGKGVPASLLMANLQATLRTLAVVEPEVARCVRSCSNQLYRSTSAEKFATLCYVQLGPDGDVTCCNAGHEPGLILSSTGSARELRVGGVPAGMLEDFPYGSETIRLDPGDILVLHSDGVTDMEDASGRELGRERLLAQIEALRNKSAADITRGILDMVDAHADGVEAIDDVTVVVIRRLASPSC